jgi:hypothetical protein
MQNAIIVDENSVQESEESSIMEAEDHIDNSTTPQQQSPSEKNILSKIENNHMSKRRKNLHSNFLLLKKKLNLEQFMRKTQIDSLLKKCKSKAFKTIHEALKKCLKCKLQRLPQEFITNIKIEFNKIYLEKSIYDIYREFGIIPSLEEFNKKGYILNDKIEVFKDFLNLTFKDVFEYYVNSKQYIKDYYHIQKREGESFAILFNYISNIFIQYYTKSKGNKPKRNCKREEWKQINTSGMSSGFNTIINVTNVCNVTNVTNVVINNYEECNKNKHRHQEKEEKIEKIEKRDFQKHVNVNLLYCDSSNVYNSNFQTINKTIFDITKESKK